MTRIGYLVDSSLPASIEELAAWRFLSSLPTVRSVRVSFQSLIPTMSSTHGPQILWWHNDSSPQLPPVALDPKVLTALRDFVRNGGSLLLSLLASQYVVDLGVEEIRPNIVSRGTWNEENWAPDYPDIRGFAMYRGHPVFEGLPGGVYTWNPSVGEEFSGAYYEDTLPGRGRVVAVDRQYIRLNERRRIISEYQPGKGRILAIGTYFFFRQRHHRFRENLEKLTLNCLAYLSPGPSGSNRKRTYWSFEPRFVKETQRTGTRRLVHRPDEIRLPEDSRTMVRNLTTSDSSNQLYNVGGTRILLAGKERGGISEVWCHPVRIARNVKAGFKVGNTSVVWSNDLNSTFIARPECVQRTTKVGNATVEETVFGHRERPCGAMHFRVASSESAEIVVTGSIDLRMMWPLNDAATGSLTFAWDEMLQAFVVNAPLPNCCAIIGSSLRPAERLAGQFSGIDVVNGTFQGNPTGETTVSLAVRYRLSPGRHEFAIFFAGSDRGEREAEQAYRAIAANPAAAIQEQSFHYRKLLSERTQIRTPDPDFHEAYAWAIASTDRFSGEVPGLGSSLFAGYGTTEQGWNGGHVISGRPGYAWYFGRDSVWTSFALLDYGDFAKVREILDFLGAHQDPSGKILHELTTSGFAHYDAADSTPLYVILMGRYLRTSGDRKFARDQFPRLSKAMEFCFSTDSDGDRLIENTNVGHGWVEGGQLFPVHTEHYLATCWAKALDEASTVAAVLGKRSTAKKWKSESEKVIRIIEKEFWNERTGFYNFGKRADGTFNEEQTILPAVGISFGFAHPGHAAQCLERYASEEFSADWGTRIVGNNSPMYDPTGYHYGSIWPLFTGWTSLAEFRMRRPVQGFVHAMNNLLLYNRFAAGTIEEVFHGGTFQPAGVCPHQAWSESMALQPLFDGMLGIDVDAISGQVSFRPYFPPDWDVAEIRNVAVGSQSFSVRMNRGTNETTFDFRTKRRGAIRVTFQPYFPLGTTIMEAVVGYRTQPMHRVTIARYDECPIVRFTLRKRSTVRFKHIGGVALVPPVPRPLPGQASGGIRVLNEAWNKGQYLLTLEGKAGHSYGVSVADPDGIVSALQGAKIEARDRARVDAVVTFDSMSPGKDYQQKTIVCMTSKPLKGGKSK